MAAGRAGRHGREVRAGHPEADRDLAGADVRDPHRDEERADAVGSAGRVRRDPLDEGPDAAEPGAEDHPGPLGLVTLEPRGQAGLIHRLAGDHQPELDIAIGPPLILAIEDAARVEVAYLGRDLRVHPGWVERLDRIDPRSTSEQALPRRGDVVAECREHPHAGHDDPPRGRRPGLAASLCAHRTSLPVRTVAAR